MTNRLKYTVEDFFNLFVKELEVSPFLHDYYKFSEKDKKFSFRKSYFLQRLQYVIDNINKDDKIWDCGCGFATTVIFLKLNGYNVKGTTLEFYFEHINTRLKYWSKYGNLDDLEITYENLFDSQLANSSFDKIIVQDTLHHLEPINNALSILSNKLINNGKIISIEENGNNIIQNIKLFLQRGNKRIIKIYDENLKKEILLGNENIRSLKRWKNVFKKVELQINNESIQYIRILPPIFIRNKDVKTIIKKEKTLASFSSILRNYLFFGINFTATKFK